MIPNRTGEEIEVSVTNALSELVASQRRRMGVCQSFTLRRRKVPTAVRCQELRIGLSHVAVVLVSFGISQDLNRL